MKKKIKKYFPCPICKGQGGWKEPILDDGSGPFDECGYCEGKGRIEIGGRIHRKWKAEKIALEIIAFVKPKREIWSYSALQRLGRKALNLLNEK